MMNIDQRQQLRKYLEIVLRKKSVIFTFLFIALLAGLGVYLTAPRVYQSSVLLSYQQQKINPSKMSPDMAARIRDTVSTLSQIVTSRTNLENIIKNQKLYLNMRQRVSMEDVIEIMRRQIDIRPSRRGDTFRITFMGGNPRKVVKVTNALAAKFIEENLKYREERASETSAYTSEELQMAKVVMDKKEGRMRDYKLNYYNEMPDQRKANVERLTALQEQYQAKQDSIQDLERTKVMAQEQLATRKKILEAVGQLVEQPINENLLDKQPKETPRHRLGRLKKHRDYLLFKYTEKHPEVKRLNRMIASQEKNLPIKDEKAETSGKKTVKLKDSIIARIEIQIRSISMNIKALSKEKTELKKLIDQYEGYVAAAPVREAEWSALTREYGELKRHYDYLVSKNLQAESVLNLERKQRGSQFKIEDPARMPEKPIKPNFLLIMAGAVAAGLGLGGGLVFGIELLDFSFKDPMDIESYLDLPVICSIPYVMLADEEKRDRRMFILGLCAFLISSLAVLAIFLYCWWKGLIVI